MAKLTDKQEFFCKEYIIDFNGTRAAKAAGYSEKTARHQAAENLSKPYICNRIKELTKERNERLEVSADRVIQELAKLGFSLTPSVDGFTLGANDKIKALDLLARATGALNKDESEKSIIKVKIGK